MLRRAKKHVKLQIKKEKQRAIKSAGAGMLFLTPYVDTPQEEERLNLQEEGKELFHLKHHSLLQGNWSYISQMD